MSRHYARSSFHLGRLDAGGLLQVMDIWRRSKNPISQSSSPQLRTPQRETSIRSSDSAEQFDIIICAAGFDASFSPSWELAGKGGSRLADQWHETGGIFWHLRTQHAQLLHVQRPKFPRGARESSGRDGVDGRLGHEVVQEDRER